MKSQNTDQNPFAHMPDLLPVEDPGYLQYWEMRSENDPEDRNVANIVRGLTRVAIRGMEERAEFTDREPSLQARYWYRSLGPLNPLKDVEPDLITAVEMMYGQRTNNPEESANLELDTTYALLDLAMVASDKKTQKVALGLSLRSLDRIEASDDFSERPAIYKLQAAITRGDVIQAIVRLKHTGDLSPTPVEGEAYRKFEKAFVMQELGNIERFGQMINSGITEENFGILFEWYFLIARRFESWSDEVVDTFSVRGATSRENAEWTGEHTINRGRVTGNHDIVMDQRRRDGNIVKNRVQLKTAPAQRHYHPGVTVIDFQEELDQRFTSIDLATDQLTRKLLKFKNQYIGGMGK